MDKETFFRLLAEEVKSYKQLLETKDNEWIVKGFIDIDKNIYTITNDTKVVSKIIEIILIPKLDLFAKKNSLTLELPTKQNYYPDLTFIDSDGNKFAVDFKSSYYENNTINGLTLGSYWGYFRNKKEKMNMDYAYDEYISHIVLGILYKQTVDTLNEKELFNIDELNAIHSVIQNFVFFVQPKWKIAGDIPGSGNTRNIGGITDIDKLIEGEGPFSVLGEDVFDDYWMNYYNKADAKDNGIGTPHYYNLVSYKEYLTQHKRLLSKL